MTLRNTLSLSPFLLAAAAAVLPAAVTGSALTSPEPAAPQERTKKKEAKDFPALLASASAAWEGGHYSKASADLKAASSLVAEKQREALLAAFPAAPEGWKFTPTKQNDAAGMMFGMTGLMIEGKYEGTQKERVTLTMNVDSPMVQAMSMAFSNPALFGDGAEVIKYGKYQGLLKKNGNDRHELSILIGDDLIKAESRGMTDDALLVLCSQAMVDKMAAALTN